MKQELGPLQKKYVADLRAGYPQTRGRLHDDIGFCCLGIATEITCGVQPTHIYDVHGQPRYYPAPGHSGNETSASLPKDIVEALGFIDSCGTFRGSYTVVTVVEPIKDDLKLTPYQLEKLMVVQPPNHTFNHTLIALNDQLRLTLDQIALIIEHDPSIIFIEPK